MNRKNALIILSFTISLLSAQEEQLSWTPEFSMNIKRLSSTTLSPDGKYIAYVVREPIMEGEKSEYLSHIWLTDIQSQSSFQYTRGEKSCTSPQFSPDGQYLAFLSGRSGKNQVWMMRTMGGEAEQITDEKNGVQSFQWSPDGQKMAFVKADMDTEEEEKAKKEKRHVIEVDKNVKYGHLYTIAEGSNGEKKVQRLTKGDFTVTAYDWSPDGKHIVFSHKTDPKINTSRVNGDISVVPADSGAVKALVTTGGIESNPRYSPDGTWIAYQSTGDQAEPIGLNDLYIIPAAGGQPKALPHTPNRSSNFIDWSDDGSNLFITEAYHTSVVAMKIPVNEEAGLVPEIISSKAGTLSSLDISSANDQMAFIYQTTDQPAEMYLAKASGFGEQKITSIHSELELPKMGKTEVISWKSKDGLAIEGILTYPVDYKEGEKYPVILQIHGGPAGVFTQSFTGNPGIYNTQYFAERGFAVIRPNPRGSTGYGKEFRYANFQDWGYGDYEDVMSGVDKVIEMGIGDEDRMAVMGWSYGGYLTSFLVTRTNRFKVASMGAGLPNLISMTTTTDIPDYLVGHMGGEFWDDYDTYEKHSAMYHIKKVSTPTQVIHGAKDLRVPFTQGQEFYVALRRRGIPTEMLVLPRTPHGPREPKLQMEVSPRILNWFEQYIEVKP